MLIPQAWALIFYVRGSPDCLEDPTILSGSLRSTLDVFEEYQDAEIVSYIPRCLAVAYDIAYCLYTSMKHFGVSISSHPKTTLLKRLTWSMPMFSGTWTRVYQKEAITFLQGQYFAYGKLDFLSHGASCFPVKNSYYVWLELSLKSQKFWWWMRYAALLSISHHTHTASVTNSDETIRRLPGLNIFNLPVVCDLWIRFTALIMRQMS